jgi:hypothetical protein
MADFHGVGLYTTSPFSPNWNHIPSVSGTLQLTAVEWRANGTIRSAATFIYASDNTSVCTVNSSSGLVTGAGTGVANITATSDSGFSAVFPVGCALLSWVTRTIAFGNSTTITASGGGASTTWQVGTPGCVVLAGPSNVAGVVTGATVTLNTIQGAFTNPIGGTATAHCPVSCNFQTGQTTLLNSLQGNANPIWLFSGIYAQSTLTVTGVPNWGGN